MVVVGVGRRSTGKVIQGKYTQHPKFLEILAFILRAKGSHRGVLGKRDMIRNPKRAKSMRQCLCSSIDSRCKTKIRKESERLENRKDRGTPSAEFVSHRGSRGGELRSRWRDREGAHEIQASIWSWV